MPTPEKFDHTQFDADQNAKFGHCKTPEQFREAQGRFIAADWARITGMSFDSMFAIAMMPPDPTAMTQFQAFKDVGVDLTMHPAGVGCVDFKFKGKFMFFGWDSNTINKMPR